MLRAVFFDLDGTLLDTAPDLTATLNQLRSREGLEALPYEQLRPAVSRGARGLLQLGMQIESEDRMAYWQQQFLQIYQDRLYRDSRPFSGIRELLQWLQSQAVPWGVVTNKWERFTLPILKASGLLPAAACVICGDTLRQSKPHPAPLRLACEIVGVAPEATVYIGDDHRDMLAAATAGNVALFADYGYSEAEDDYPHRVGEVAEIRPWLEARMKYSGQR